MKHLLIGLGLALIAGYVVPLAAQQSKPKDKKVITISSDADLEKNAKALKADSTAIAKHKTAEEKEADELDAYINSIDWEAERLRWLEWYGNTTENDPKNQKTTPDKPK